MPPSFRSRPLRFGLALLLALPLAPVTGAWARTLDIGTRRETPPAAAPASSATPSRRGVERGLAVLGARARRARVRALGIPPDDPAYATTNGQRVALGDSLTYPHAVDLEPAWRQAFLGLDHSLNPYRSGVKVALIDSGASAFWREDAGRFVQVKDYIDDDRTTQDAFGHGTRVASVIGAKTGNGFGIAGAVADARVDIEVYRVLDANGYGTTEDTLRAIMDAADRGCRVINCSLGEPLEDGGAETVELRALYEQAVSYASSRGAIVVAAAGNNAGPVMYPAATADAIAVGSIDAKTGLRAGTSAYGPQLDLVAPGQGAWVVTSDGRIGTASGTSFAAPVVSGTLALLWSLLPSLPAQDIRDAVLSTAEDYPSSAPDGVDAYYGNGKLDAWAAYRRLMETVPEQVDVSVSASAPEGFWTSLSWTPAAGSGVFYRYGYLGGPEFQTTATSGRLFLDGDGARTVYVKEYCSDRWANSTLATATVTVATGLPPLAVRRYAGADRYGTALAVSSAAYPGTATAVVIASGANWPDALSAGVLAYAAGGPLLLTPPSSLPIAVRDEVVRLRPQRVYIVGGTSAVSTQVQARLEALVGPSRVTRVGGGDRYATAGAIASRVRAVLGGASPGTAVVVSGESFPDALSAAAYAARAGFPILLARRDGVPAATRAALGELGVRRAVVAGGTAAISTSVARSLPRPQRVAGRDRYDTSRRFEAFAVKEGVLSAEEMALATGRRFPDALSAAPLAAARRGGVVLCEGLDPDTRGFFDARTLQLRRLTFLGGTASLSAEFENALITRLRTP